MPIDVTATWEVDGECVERMTMLGKIFSKREDAEPFDGAVFINCLFTGTAAEMAGECLYCYVHNCFNGSIPVKRGFGSGKSRFINCQFSGDYVPDYGGSEFALNNTAGGGAAVRGAGITPEQEAMIESAYQERMAEGNSYTFNKADLVQTSPVQSDNSISGWYEIADVTNETDKPTFNG